MPETSSAKTAEAVTPFASPMLESIERLVSRLARRIAGPQSQFSGRSLQFADRVFSRRLATLSTTGVTPETALMEREIEPQKWLLPSSWVPSAAALRAGARSAPIPARAPAADHRAPTPTLTLPGSAARPGEPASQSLPSPRLTPEAASAAAVAVAGTPASSLAHSSSAAAAVTDAALPALPATAASVPRATDAAHVPSSSTAGVAPAAKGASPLAAAAPAAAGRAAPEQSMPQIMPAWQPEPRAKSAHPAAATASKVAPQAAPAAAPAVAQNTEFSPSAAPEAGADSPAAPDAVLAPSAAGQPGASPDQRLTAPNAAAAGAAELQPRRPPEHAAAGAAAHSAHGSASGTVPSVGPQRQQPPAGSAPVPTAAAVADSGARADGHPRNSAPLPVPDGLSASAQLPAEQGETRVRDWLRPLLHRKLQTEATGTGRSSAFARSLGHLGWSDERLGQGAPQRGRILAPDFGSLTEPESSPRAAAAPALQLVRATDLTPRGAVRAAKQPVPPTKSAAALVTPLRPEAPLAPLGLSSPAAGDAAASGASPGAAAAAAIAPATAAVGELALGLAAAGAPGAGREPVRSEAAPPPAAGTAVARPLEVNPTATLPPPRSRSTALAAVPADSSASALFAPLSPGLLASPVLREPHQARGAATLIGLFAAGQSGRAGMPPASELPSGGARSLSPTPGALATHIERMAAAIGTHAAAGSAGVDNPFGSVHGWRSAPGLARGVSDALGSTDPSGVMRRTQLSTTHALPYLPSPDRESVAPMSAVAAARAPSQPAGSLFKREQPVLPVAAASPAASPGSAGTPLYRWPQAGPETTLPAQLRAPSGEPASDAAPGRPWRLAGGMATLAELFAAGIGLGTGAAGDLARKAGVSSAIGLMPPWLARAAARPRFGLLGGPSAAARPGRRSAELEFVDLTESPKTTASDEPAAPGSWQSAPAAMAAERLLPAVPAPVPPPLQPTAPSSAQEPALAAAALQPFWQQAGGLAATAEAFARSHGIDRADRLAAAGPAAPPAGRWVPVTGGMMFIGDETQRSGMTPAAAGLSRQTLPFAPPHEMAMDRSAQIAAGQAGAASRDAAGPLSTWPQRPASAAVSPLGPTAPESARGRAGALSFLRGVDWGRAGGLGLRTELMAAGMDPAGVRALSPSATDERAAWSMAPGVASKLARALRTSRAQPVARWTLGDDGLLFISGPDFLGGSASTSAAASAALPASQLGRAASALTAPAANARFVMSQAPVPPETGELRRQAGMEYAATVGFSALSERPWLKAGGTAILAELFSAGVGLSAGAVNGLAQQAGVAAGRSLLPGWLLGLLRAGGPLPDGDEQLRRVFGAALPFVTPDERKPAPGRRTAGVRPVPQAPAASVRGQALPAGPMPLAAEQRHWPLTAAAAVPSLWPQAGGLGASAEAFARGRGIVRADGEAAVDDDSGEAPAGRWLPVSGGMVFVPAERPAAARGKRAPAATRPGGHAATPPATEPPTAASAARPLDWPHAGGLGLRSELFTSGLGQPAAAGAAPSSDPLGGWAGAHQLLASFPRQEPTEATPPRRFAWSGAGGLLYLTAASPPPRTQRRAAASIRQAPRGPAGASEQPGPVAATPSGSHLPGGFAALAERFSAGLGSEPTARELEAGAPGSNALPLAALRGGRSPESRTPGAIGSSVSGAALPGRLADTMLTGFPRATAGAPDAAADAWPRAALHSVERLGKLLAQLPAKWHPSAAVATAMQASAAADSPIWQRLSPNLTRLAATALRADSGGSSDEGTEDGPSERHTHLTLVKGSSPGAAQKAQRAGEPAWKQQTPQAMVSAALQKVAGSGTPMAAAAKMLESVRGQSGAQASRPDDRISLGDLTLIAISMGENRMAAISKSQSPSPVPHVESALRQDDSQLVQPETEHTMNQKVDALAKMCLKYVEKHEKMMKERGSFDA